MSAPVTVHIVETPADLKTFLRFPWTVYKDDPYWVPPLVSMQRHKLDKRKNPTWQHMEGDYFLARRGDQPVGTIAAFINHRHNEFQGEHIGFFGMFEVFDDQEAANALLETAAGYVRERGYDAIRGPASFSTNDECGILVEGFGQVPAVLTPYNPPYYQRLLDHAPGYAPVMDLLNYHFTLRDFHTSKSLEQSLRVTRKNNERRKIVVRSLERRRMRAELSMLKDIYNSAWEKNWGFVPLSEAELDEMVQSLGQFVEPRLVLFATVAGKPAAFLLAMPDLNEALHPAYPRPGKPEIFCLAQAVWHWKLRPKITRIRIALLGVDQGYRGIGVEAALFARLFEVFQELTQEKPRWQAADAGWVLETNEPMNRLVQALGGKPYKRFRFYERALIERHTTSSK
jgi:GNAT superfamily N-acetyltransferase